MPTHIDIHIVGKYRQLNNFPSAPRTSAENRDAREREKMEKQNPSDSTRAAPGTFSVFPLRFSRYHAADQQKTRACRSWRRQKLISVRLCRSSAERERETHRYSRIADIRDRCVVVTSRSSDTCTYVRQMPRLVLVR